MTKNHGRRPLIIRLSFRCVSLYLTGCNIAVYIDTSQPLPEDDNTRRQTENITGECLQMSIVFIVVTFRSMCGVHYRFDSEEGLVLGEAVGVRMLQQVRIHTGTVYQTVISTAPFLPCFDSHFSRRITDIACTMHYKMPREFLFLSQCTLR